MPLSRNLGTLTSWNPLGHSGPVTGLIYLLQHTFRGLKVIRCVASSTSVSQQPIITGERYIVKNSVGLIIIKNNNNQQVQTDRTIPNNKPDIIIRDNETGTCMLIDVAISGDRNVIKKRSREDSKI